MKPRRWFLPETPDVLGLLREQVATVIEGVDAFAAWGDGAAEARAAVADAEARGDVAKRRLLDALRTAFVTPVEPEDVFALSRGVDRIMSAARGVVEEAEVLEVGPDERIAGMARLIGEAVRCLDAAIAQLAGDRDAASQQADAALAAEGRLRQASYDGMAALLHLDARTERIARRELYRRCAAIGDIVDEAAERVVYAVVKQS